MMEGVTKGWAYSRLLNAYEIERHRQPITDWVFPKWTASRITAANS